MIEKMIPNSVFRVAMLMVVGLMSHSFHPFLKFYLFLSWSWAKYGYSSHTSFALVFANECSEQVLLLQMSALSRDYFIVLWAGITSAKPAAQRGKSRKWLEWCASSWSLVKSQLVLSSFLVLTFRVSSFLVLTFRTQGASDEAGRMKLRFRSLRKFRGF